jgi:dienelactone hydrolase
MFWANGRDPFQRIWFKARAPGAPKAECIAVLPKMGREAREARRKGKHPLVVYLHEAGGSLIRSGNDLRQMAEMGLAAVGIEYSQGSKAESAAQLAALLDYVGRQKWADTNRMAWVGYSLGAQRLLACALDKPERSPKLLVCIAGGWVPELDAVANRARARERARSGEIGDSPEHVLPFSVLVVHGEQDEILPLSGARRLAQRLGEMGVRCETRLLAGQPHGFGRNRLLVSRVVGEYCLTRLAGPDALTTYESILSWQTKAKPLWVYWIPAGLWVGYWVYLRRRRQVAALHQTEGQKAKLSPWEVGLRWVAGLLASLALGQTALHVVPPRLPVSEHVLAIARRHIVQPKELADFDFLSGSPRWRGQRLKTLLEHVELAHYNRELVDWKLEDAVYRDFVLSPEIDPAADGALDWRRPLWENFYPRIRKEPTTETAAEIVAAFLRERVTIARGVGLPGTISEAWARQITDARGFEALYVAAMRSCGVPARLDASARAEFWTGAAWQAASRPLVESW